MLVSITRSYRSSFAGLSRETWLLSSVILINRAGTMVIPFLTMYLTVQKHMNLADTGIIATLFGVGALGGSMLGGWLVDRIGFRKVQMLSAFIGGGLFMLLGVVDGFWWLCLVTLLVGLVAEAFRPANLAAVAAYASPEVLTRSYSLNRLAMNIGWAVGSSTAGLLAAINYHLLFWVEGVAYLMVGAMVWLLLPDVKKVAAHQTEKTDHADRSDEPPLYKDRYLSKFLLLNVVYLTCFIIMFRLVPVYWKTDLHIDEKIVGLLLGLNGVVITFLEMVLVKYWESKNKSMFYIVSGMIATAAGYIVLLAGELHPLLTALAAVLFLTFGEMLALPFISSGVMHRANQHNRGKYAAALAVSFAAANIIGPAGAALIAGAFGYKVLWVVVTVLCLFAAWGFASIRDKRTKA